MRPISSNQTFLDQSIDVWISELDQYSFSQLIAKPSVNAWSLGQVYMHLIESTIFFNKQILCCTSNNNNVDDESYAAAKTMFSNNDLPDRLLDGPPSNAVTPQPESKEQIIAGLLKIKDELKKSVKLIEDNQFEGKTKHFGLGYFTAAEWLQFAEMHMRHHLRQKKRLDEFLNLNNIR